MTSSFSSCSLTLRSWLDAICSHCWLNYLFSCYGSYLHVGGPCSWLGHTSTSFFELDKLAISRTIPRSRCMKWSCLAFSSHWIQVYMYSNLLIPSAFCFYEYSSWVGYRAYSGQSRCWSSHFFPPLASADLWSLRIRVLYVVVFSCSCEFGAVSVPEWSQSMSESEYSYHSFCITLAFLVSSFLAGDNCFC